MSNTSIADVEHVYIRKLKMAQQPIQASVLDHLAHCAMLVMMCGV